MTDPWAWLQRDGSEPEFDHAAHPVSAVVLTELAGVMTPLLAAQTVQPSEVVVADSLIQGAAMATGKWLWLFPQIVRPAPDALERLLRSAAGSQRIGVIGPLMVQSQRRARVDLIESCGLTVTPIGRMVPAVEGGEPDQGQLSSMAVLGVDATAALVRRDVWQQVDGVLDQLPPALAGLELGRRVNSAGRRVVAEPSARAVRAAAQPVDATEQRTWELRLAAAGRSWITRLRLLIGSLLGAIGFLLGKDAVRAGAEIGAIGRWLTEHGPSAVLDGRAVDPKTLTGLTPSRRELVGQAFDRAAGAVAEAWSELADRGADTSLDELTGDDYAAKGRLRRLSPLTIGSYLVGILALVAGRRLIGDGRLVAEGLLPSQQRWDDLLHAWLDPVAGQAAVSGPPWLGGTALAALATAGQVEWLVTATLLSAVPLAWFLALRTLRRRGVEGAAAAIGALGYALTPALAGALGGGWLGVLTWAVLLPLLASALLDWTAAPSWRAAGGVALWVALAVSVVPLAWPLVLLAMAVVPAVRSVRGMGQATLVAAAGAVGLGQALLSWGTFPGRFLTAASPSLATLAAPDPWLLALGSPDAAKGAPLWIGATVVGVAWVAALIGVIRRPAEAAPGLITAAIGLLAAVVLSRLVVVVPPGVEARPQAVPWVILMMGGLTFAAARGLSGLAAELRHHTLGARHAAVLALTGVAIFAVGLGAAWWAWDGTSGLRRTDSADLPPFVRIAMTSATPVRTLAIARAAGEIRWALLEGELPRLGEDERGLPGTRDPQRTLATSVVNRLLSGSADDQLGADLNTLGVGYVWLKGSDPSLRTSIGNVPGLGVGTGDEAGATWPVPNSAIAMIDGQGVAVTGNGQHVEAGSDVRRLVLAEPADPRWRASVDGRALAPLVLPDGRQAFLLGTQPGQLRIELADPAPVWPVLQLGALAVLAILAAPRLRARR